jgi:hypothetical protein
VIRTMRNATRCSAVSQVSARQYSDEDIVWLTERVRYYLRKGIQTVYAIDRAKADFRKR